MTPLWVVEYLGISTENVIEIHDDEIMARTQVMFYESCGYLVWAWEITKASNNANRG